MVQKQAFLKPASTDELKRCAGEDIPELFTARWAELADTVP